MTGNDWRSMSQLQSLRTWIENCTHGEPPDRSCLGGSDEKWEGYLQGVEDAITAAQEWVANPPETRPQMTGRWKAERVERGLKQYAPIVIDDGQQLLVLESSASNGPRLWLAFSGLVGGSGLHLSEEQVYRLTATLREAIESHYQQGSGR